jgi:hypothetical protein
MARNLAWGALATAMGLGVSTSALAQDMQRCNQLAAYYDRYGGRVSEGRTPIGRLDRELGFENCRKGNFAEGIRMLEQAIRRMGYNVPPG